MDNIVIRRPDDLHVHLRDGAVLRDVVASTAMMCERALVMPNVPCIETGPAAVAYAAEIAAACAAAGVALKPLMTIKLTQRTTPAVIEEARACGVVAAKLYPCLGPDGPGVTTGAHDGVHDPDALDKTFAAMAACGMVLCVHGEMPGSFVLDRERNYLFVVAWIVRNIPGLKVVLEHITTADAVAFIKDAPATVAGTVTAHHLFHSLDDVIGFGLKPHNFCYPVPKTYDDRRALVAAVYYSDEPRLFFGSDSAPHIQANKESSCGCAGVFSAPVALSTLAEVFFSRPEGHLSPVDGMYAGVRRRALENFTSRHGAAFYGLEPNVGTVTLVREPWTVPARVGAVVPWRAGETLAWRVTD